MLGDKDKEMSEMARKFIVNFADVLEDNLSMFQISREVYSQHIPFRGKAQVVLVLLEAGFSRSPDLRARFRELVKEGCKVIGVPMPDFKITDFQKWWPDEMEEFKNFSLFFDCRAGPEQTERTMDRQDMEGSNTTGTTVFGGVDRERPHSD